MKGIWKVYSNHAWFLRLDVAYGRFLFWTDTPFSFLLFFFFSSLDQRPLKARNNGGSSYGNAPEAFRTGGVRRNIWRTGWCAPDPSSSWKWTIRFVVPVWLRGELWHSPPDLHQATSSPKDLLSPDLGQSLGKCCWPLGLPAESGSTGMQAFIFLFS